MPQQPSSKSVSFTLEDDFSFADDDEPITANTNNYSSFGDDDVLDGNRSPILTNNSTIAPPSPEIDFDDDLDNISEYNYENKQYEENLSQSLSDIVDNVADKQVKTEIDELFDEYEREEEENYTSVKSPILTMGFTASTQRYTVSSPVSSPGLSQYQKEQRNVYQYDDINELSTLTSQQSPKISQPVIEIVENCKMQDDNDEEESAFHKLDTSVKCNPENIVNNNQATQVIENTTRSPPSQKNTPKQLSQQLNEKKNEVVPDSQEIDIDFSQLEEALNEPELASLNNSKIEEETPKSSPMEILRSKIPSSPQKKKPLKLVQSYKDEIICTPEFSVPQHSMNMDEIENSENSQMDVVKIEPRPSSPSKPLSWREALYKNRHTISPQKIVQPDRELVAIKDYFGLTTFQRGNNYSSEERIYEMNAELLEVQEGDELTFLSAKCWGTVEVPYQQSIVFEEKTMSIRKCVCSCPVEHNCKHSCAALITWFNCKKKSLPYPSLDSTGKKLEEAIEEMSKLRQELESLKKENEILKSSANSDYSSGSEDFDMRDASTPTKTHHSGFISSNNLDKTPSRDPTLLPSFISPSPASVDNSLKRKRTDFTLDPNNSKKVHH